ncbi:hypothetical protein HK101_003928, partial [Irineochytrium annulatum]
MRLGWTMPTSVLAGAIAAVILIATPTLAAFSSPYATYSAILMNSTTAQITVSATSLPSTSWVGLGIPGTQQSPGMGGADLFLFFTLDNSTVTMQHNTGLIQRVGAAPSQAVDPVFLVPGQSSYKNGALTAVFTRLITSGDNVTIPTGQ